MSFLKGINRSACTAWSPLPQYADCIATATVVGTTDLNFDTSGHLEIFQLDTSSEVQISSIAKVELPDRAQSLAWGSSGLIACGLPTGAIHFLDSNNVLQHQSDAGTVTVKQHNAAVSVVEFNKLQPQILASGGEDSEVFIWNLAKPDSPVGYAPGVTQAKKEPITGLNWNPQAPYILATISQTGKVSVWDLRSKRVAVQFADRRITSARAISWNPNNPMQLITGSEDDSSPVIQVWNIRHTQMPTSTLQGHAQGIWSTSWCPHDTSYLLSTGKENRALCWNVDDGSLLHQVELRSEWNSEIQWSPQVPALFSVSSYQGQIGVYSLHDVQGKRDDLGALVSAPPAWLKRKAGASFGFGGRLVSVQQSLVTISSTVSSTPELEGYAEKLKSLLTIENYQDYCSSRASDSQSQQEREIWEFLQSQFEENPREYLLSRLGFSKEQLDEALERAVSSLEKLKLPQESESLPVSDKQAEQPDAVPQEPEIKREKDELASLFDSTPSGEDPFAGSNEADFFSFQSSHHDNLFDDLGSNLQDVHGAPSSSFADHHQNEPAYQSILDLAQNISKPIQLQGLADQESLLAQALILGNFSAAVNFCLGTGRLTDGLVIALASNDHSLVDRARDAYFQSLAPNSYLHIVDHVVRGQLRQLVAKTDVHEWKSTLGILCSYGSADEFAGLVSDLGSLLLHHQLEHPALLCFIIAGNVDKAIGVLERSLKVEDNSFASLQNIIEKVTIFKQANRNYTLSEALIQRYCACAEFLSAQGLLNYASDLISFLDQPAYDHAVKGKELLSRIRASLQEEQNLSGEYFRDTPASSGWDDVGFTQSGAQPVESVPQPHTNSDIGSVPSYHQAHPQYGIPASSPYPGNTLSSEPLAQTYNPHGSAFPGTQPVGGFTPANPFPAATPVVSQPVGGFTPANPFPAATPVVSQPVGGFTPANPFPGQSVNTFTPANPVGGFTPANPFPGQSVNTFTPANPFPAPTTQPIRQQVPDIPPVESLPSSVVGGSTPVGGPFGTPAAAPVPATPAAPAVRAPGIEIVERFTAIVNNYKVQYASDANTLRNVTQGAEKVIGPLKDLIERRQINPQGLEKLTNFVQALESKNQVQAKQIIEELSSGKALGVPASVCLGLKKLNSVQ